MLLLIILWVVVSFAFVFRRKGNKLRVDSLADFIILMPSFIGIFLYGIGRKNK